MCVCVGGVDGGGVRVCVRVHVIVSSSLIYLLMLKMRNTHSDCGKCVG